jgi:phage terminase large subunit
VHTVAGGESFIVLRGWEAVETLRGQQFDFLVLDEVASMRNFWVNWREVLRPTLTDTEGEALFISTPKGFNHFYDLFNMQEENHAYTSFHYTSYDNPHIKREEIDAAKGDSNFEQEYLADFRKAEGLVYKEFDRQKHVYTGDTPATVETIVGVDFGFVHPAAVLVIKRDSSDGLWVESEFYERGRTDIEIAEYVAALNANAVYPDPESPSAIEEMRRRGVNVRPVVKGKDSEKHGIDRVRERLKADKLHVHRSCKNLISEFETHAYKDGKDEPEDEGEDALDALRYPIMMTQAYQQPHELPYIESEPLYEDIGI